MSDITRRSLIGAALGASPLLALPFSTGLGLMLSPGAAEAAVDATAINDWFRGLRTARGRFRQLNPDGSMQTGKYHISRPGKTRFEYDSPKGSVIISNGHTVAIFDAKSNRRPTKYPLNRTPLNILLDTGTSLGDEGMVLGATQDRKGVHLTVQNPKNPKQGRMILTFSTNPIRLTGWVAVNGSGRTRVDLLSLEQPRSLSGTLFSIENEEFSRGR